LAIFRIEISLCFQQFEYHFLFPAEQGFFQQRTGNYQDGTGNLAARFAVPPNLGKAPPSVIATMARSGTP
jgi:hypothetical protein